MSFVELIAYYAAPTLEGMKPSCLFSCRDSEVGNVEELVLAYNRCLNPKRIYLQIMKHSPDFKLILVYHKDLLDTHLCQEDIQQFLSAFGYGFIICRNICARNAFLMKSVSFSDIRWMMLCRLYRTTEKIIRKSDTGRFITISPVREKQRHAFCRAWNVLWKNCRKAFLWNS